MQMMLLYKRVDSFSDFIDVQDDINRVDVWVTSNKLCLNVYKCKFTLVSRKKRGISPNTPKSFSIGAGVFI